MLDHKSSRHQFDPPNWITALCVCNDNGARKILSGDVLLALVDDSTCFTSSAS
jgi:hypothetical protein